MFFNKELFYLKGETETLLLINRFYHRIVFYYRVEASCYHLFVIESLLEKIRSNESNPEKLSITKNK